MVTENFIQLRLPFYVLPTTCCRQLMIKRSQLSCYSTCQRHDILLQKLQALVVSFSCRDWFHSYLVGRSQRVLIPDAISYALPLKYIVPQGSILGPVLFTIYAKDLLSVPSYCKSACYVDDSKLYLSFPSSDMSTAIHNLNADLFDSLWDVIRLFEAENNPGGKTLH